MPDYFPQNKFIKWNNVSKQYFSYLKIYPLVSNYFKFSPMILHFLIPPRDHSSIPAICFAALVTQTTIRSITKRWIYLVRRNRRCITSSTSARRGACARASPRSRRARILQGVARVAQTKIFYTNELNERRK